MSRSSLRASALLLLALSLAGSLTGSLIGCEGGGEPPDAGSDPGLDAGIDAGPAPTDAGSIPSQIGPADRPAAIVVPPAHDGVTELPLFVLLHGYSAAAVLQDFYFRLSEVARSEGFYLVLPDGTVDSRGNRFWNATPACCNFDGSEVDDVAYLRGLVHEMKERFPVDERRVYFLGHSNGGFMSYRMACEMADEVTAIASLAGSDFLEDEGCVPSQPVSVLQIHGTLDDSVAYEGEPGYHPSARAVIERWAGRAGCDPAEVSALPSLDLESTIEGEETAVERWESGCEEGLDAELWTIEGGSHLPTFTDLYRAELTSWLLRHSR